MGKHVRSAWRARILTMVLAGAATFMAPAAFAQQPQLLAAPAAVPPDAVFGFETTAAWQVSTSASTATQALTIVRTQGAVALSVSNPGNEAKLTSRSVP